MRVLVVEDDPDLNRQLVKALGDAGYAIDSAKDGEEGYFLGDTEPYDVVILDLGLPKMDGLSILEQWRRRPPGGRRPAMARLRKITPEPQRGEAPRHREPTDSRASADSHRRTSDVGRVLASGNRQKTSSC